MNTKIYIIFMASFLSLLSCNKKETKNNKAQSAKMTAATNDSVQAEEETPRKESINLFRLTYRDSSDVAFVSLSDIYPLNAKDDDKLILPEIEKMGIKAAEYFTFDNKYRKRFLTETNTSETDSLFVYDYSKNKLAAFSIKNLKTAAFLNPYSSEDAWPYHWYDYMIGFEINTQSLKGFSDYYSDVLVYVGKENPFTNKPLTPIVWTKISAKDFPKKAIKKEDLALLKNKAPGNTYSYQTEEYHYFLQEYLNSTEVGSRRLLVIDAKTKEIITEKMFIESEGSSPAPLNSAADEVAVQYTGKLFKNKPPVVFGFQYQSFGCSAISLIDKSNEDIYIQCDNRH